MLIATLKDTAAVVQIAQAALQEQEQIGVEADKAEIDPAEALLKDAEPRLAAEVEQEEMSESERARAIPTTLQKSSVSTNSTVSGSLLPRRSPGPPTSVSIHPRIRQRMSPAYHPLPPPMRQTAA